MADHRDADTLRQLYHGEGLTLQEVADRLGVGYGTVHRWMDKHEIERRSVAEANRSSPEVPEDDLRKMYWDEELDLEEIGDKLEVDKVTVLNWMKKYEIERRSRAEAITKDSPWADEEVMRELYVEQHLSGDEIAERLDCNRTTVYRWLDRHGIEKRSNTDYMRGAPSLHTPPSAGYERFTGVDHTGKKRQVYHHRLLAVALWGFDAVCGKEVHHVNHIHWDNRPKNLELLTSEEHTRRHAVLRANEITPPADLESKSKEYQESLDRATAD